MKIAGQFQSNEWPTLRARLLADDAAAWEVAVGVLRQRLCGRYLVHARELLHRKYSGFAVLAIDCAVIEALEQFRRGEQTTPHKKCKVFFRSFLTTSRFMKFFDAKTADLFYTTIRCGILHQAESEKDSLVKNTGASFVVQLSKTRKGLIINARRFHEELEAAVEDYIKALLSGAPIERKHFVTKMNYVARAQPHVRGVV